MPAGELLRVQPGTRRLDRTVSELLLNPFDARALAVGLRLRRPGEPLTVLSMGPAGAAGLLQEALALGADRAVHLTDPALAGSDTLATSRVLARALEQVGAEVVLAGARSTDAETGQVPAEVAALLGIPSAGPARSITRDPAGPGFEVVVDTRLGWARRRLRSPCVLSVGEKIAKPLKLDASVPRSPAPGSVESWGVFELGFRSEEVGAAGSPTEVFALREEAPVRSPVLFQEGPVEERVRGAVERFLDPARPVAPRAGLVEAAIGISRSAETALLVTTDGGAIDRAALGVLSELARSLSGPPIVAIALGPRLGETDREEIRRSGAGHLMEVTFDREEFDADQAARGLARALAFRPSLADLLVISDPFGREVAGRCAAAQGLGLVGDATGLSVGPGGGLVYSKPAFGGGVVALVRCRTRPALATIRPGGSGRIPLPDGRGPMSMTELPAPSEPPAIERIDSGATVDPSYGEIDGAELLVTVGMGIGGPEGIARLLPTLRRWGAALGATRRVVDAGWLPVQCQIGLTGRSAAPERAILLGVGKAQNHVVGLRRARAILAVNPDPGAQVFRYVDVGLVAPWEEALPALDAALSPGAPIRSGAPGR